MIGNIGPTEVILIGGVLVLLFGAKKIPELAKGIGQGLRHFKKEVHGVEESLTTVQDKTSTSLTKL